MPVLSYQLCSGSPVLIKVDAVGDVSKDVVSRVSGLLLSVAMRYPQLTNVQLCAVIEALFYKRHHVCVSLTFEVVETTISFIVQASDHFPSVARIQ